MIKLPFILAAMSILGVSFAGVIPEEVSEHFSKLNPTALVAVIALATLFFSYRLICVQQRAQIHTMISSIKEAVQPLKEAIEPLSKVSKKLDGMPCLLNKDVTREFVEIILTQIKQQEQKG